MSATYSEQGNCPTRSGVKAATLALSLVASALLAALSLASPEHAWLRWSAFGGLLPLFVAIRVLRPGRASLAGALCGLALFVFSVAVFNTGVSDGWPMSSDVGDPMMRAGSSVQQVIGSPTFEKVGHPSPDTGIPEGLLSLLLLTAIPAIYAYLAAKLTRWIGFSPFVLGVTWMGVELAFEPLGLHNGLLAGTQADGTLIHWLGGALGYVLVAFVVALVNAALVSVLSRVGVNIPGSRYVPVLTEGGTLFVPQTFSCFPLFTIRGSQPRAPPIGLVHE